MTITVAASSITMLRTTIRSRLAIASNTSPPMPGSEKTRSMTTVPAIRLANCRPITVSTGTKALRKTCRHKVWRSLRPLARAVRTKSSRSTSSTAERAVQRALHPARVALERRAVQAELEPERLHGLGRRAFTEAQLGGIAGQHVEHREDHRRRCQQGQHEGGEAFEQEQADGNFLDRRQRRGEAEYHGAKRRGISAVKERTMAQPIPFDTQQVVLGGQWRPSAEGHTLPLENH